MYYLVLIWTNNTSLITPCAGGLKKSPTGIQVPCFMASSLKPTHQSVTKPILECPHHRKFTLSRKQSMSQRNIKATQNFIQNTDVNTHRKKSR